MKVLLTTPTYPPFNSGLGNAVSRQARALAAQGVDVVVATGGQQRSSSVEQDGVRIERFAVSGAQNLRSPIRGDADAYRAFLIEENYDALVMHAWQTWSTDVALAMLATLKGRKYVYSHCISTNMWLSFAPLRSLIMWLLWRPYWWALPRRMRQLDGIFFLADGGSDSRFDDLRLARRVGAAVHVVPNSIESSAPLLDDVDRDQIISIGSFTPAKGFDFVIEAYAKSSARNCIPLVLFGQELTPYARQLSALAASRGIRPDMLSLRVGVTGAELMQHYRRARLFVSGSYTECQPLVLLDAMHNGTPFVARDTGCIAQMAGGRSVRTASDAAYEMDDLLANAEAWRALSVAGQTAATTTYAPERNTLALTAVLREGRLG